MTSWFRSKRHLRLVAAGTLLLTGAVLLFWQCRSDFWTTADDQLLDRAYRLAVAHGHGPKASDRIVYLTITDRTYRSLGRNNLDREFLARVNDALGRFGAVAVAYDIIFARPSTAEADRRFADAVEALGVCYLPAGFALDASAHPFRWEAGPAYDRLRTDHLIGPVLRGEGRPYRATRALVQMDDFALACFNSGHISAMSDPDGVFRRVPMLVQVDDRFIPALSLAMFLDHYRISPENMDVTWGERIVVPAVGGSGLDADLVIPIDNRGMAMVPFVGDWAHDFKKMEIHEFLRYAGDPNLEGNLSEFFEGQFVFIADVSVGVSDLGPTSLEPNAPLVSLHAALLNGMLHRQFFTRWSRVRFLCLISLLGVCLGAAAAFRFNGLLYGAGLGGVLAILALTWQQFTNWTLLPAAGVLGSFLFLLFSLVAGLQVAVSRDRAFIRNAFSRYVPRRVVNELLENPSLLQLGGEEREISVLFSDIGGFTSFSEVMTPTDLVQLLNEYLTEMTDIIQGEDGIVDKYIGDAVMAEFGVPLPLPDHADRAVRAGLKMQARLHHLRSRWRQRDLPEITCRVGINTGFAVVGNMGSDQVFDYTAMGDAVNLASRLESANKYYGTGLMISEFTLSHLTPGAFQLRLLDVIRVKGKSRAVRVYEVYGAGEDRIEEASGRYYGAYDAAMAAYLARDFAGAKKKFEEALAHRLQDPAAQTLLERIRGLDPDRLGPDWDGSAALSGK